jgi:arylsulfatase A
MKRMSALLLGLVMGWANVQARGAVDRPNIVYIMLDEWGYYEMSALGHPLLETPTIDRLAREGTRPNDACRREHHDA